MVHLKVNLPPALAKWLKKNADYYEDGKYVFNDTSKLFHWRAKLIRKQTKQRLYN